MISSRWSLETFLTLYQLDPHARWALDKQVWRPLIDLDQDIVTDPDSIPLADLQAFAHRTDSRLR